jgi:hypothetical protein
MANQAEKKLAKAGAVATVQYQQIISAVTVTFFPLAHD